MPQRQSERSSRQMPLPLVATEVEPTPAPAPTVASQGTNVEGLNQTWFVSSGTPPSNQTISQPETPGLQTTLENLTWLSRNYVNQTNAMTLLPQHNIGQQTTRFLSTTNTMSNHQPEAALSQAQSPTDVAIQEANRILFPELSNLNALHSNVPIQLGLPQTGAQPSLSPNVVFVNSLPRATSTYPSTWSQAPATAPPGVGASLRVTYPAQATPQSVFIVNRSQVRPMYLQQYATLSSSSTESTSQGVDGSSSETDKTSADDEPALAKENAPNFTPGLLDNLQKLNLPRSSLFRGVSWHKRGRKWVARIWMNGKSHHLGVYNFELQAALAVDKKLSELGENASALNFPTNAERLTAEERVRQEIVQQGSIRKANKRPQNIAMDAFLNQTNQVSRAAPQASKQRKLSQRQSSDVPDDADGNS